MNKLPSNWQVKALGDLFHIYPGGTPSRNKMEYWNGDVPWVKISDMLRNNITDTEEKISAKGLENSSAKIIPKGSLLISIFATVGRTAFLEIDAATNQAIVGLVAKENNIDKKFVRYYLDSKVEALKNISRGVAQSNINKSILSSIKIPLPPLPIQKQIAEILEKADRAKQKRKEANKLADEFLQSVFIEMFGDPVKNPKGWEVTEFKSIAVIERNSVVSEKLSESDLYVGLEHIEKETGRLLGFEHVGEIDLKSNKFKFTLEHILYGKLRPYLNKVCLPNINGVCSTDIIPIKTRQNVSSKQFLAFLMRQEFFVKEATVKSAGANLPRISPNILEKFKVFVPPIQLQQQFAEIVNKVEALKEKQKQSEKELENLFQSLMQKAFKGKLL